MSLPRDNSSVCKDNLCLRRSGQPSSFFSNSILSFLVTGENVNRINSLQPGNAPTAGPTLPQLNVPMHQTTVTLSVHGLSTRGRHSEKNIAIMKERFVKVEMIKKAELLSQETCKLVEKTAHDGQIEKLAC